MKIALVVTVAGLLLAGTPAFSGSSSDNDSDSVRVAPVSSEVVQAECGACHMAYPPRFLPAASWRAIMAGLEDHFGEDATLDDKLKQGIESFLVDHAARGRAGKNPPLRITELRWWRGEHGRMKPYLKRLSKRYGRKIKMSECTVCHRAAERGNYDDD